jgi:hydrogenase nickel incorporation protein HypA/HybF
MHELSLIDSLLDIVEEYAAKHRFAKVNTLKLTFGRLACIEPNALEFAFAVQSKGTKADGAALECEIFPIVISCLRCEKDFPVPTYPAACPSCGGCEVVLKGGREELKLVEMDVD